ncbi:MAG TPA: Maf family protein [Terriglobales bacterium]|nr:Maf family protein [Terriglobales bacterium]
MLVLASASPRRQELLRNAGIAFVVAPTDIPEVPQPHELPKDFVERLACEKARVIARQYTDALVLGADTTVVVGEEILNKPADAEDARRMLRKLSGRTHQVMTGVCLITPQAMRLGAEPRTENRELRTEVVRSETTLVTFDRLTDNDIDFYVRTGEPMDKAGAYAIQGIASRWISRIEGDYTNVVGLPVAPVYRMLHEMGFTPESLNPPSQHQCWP